MNKATIDYALGLYPNLTSYIYQGEYVTKQQVINRLEREESRVIFDRVFEDDAESHIKIHIESDQDEFDFYDWEDAEVNNNHPQLGFI